MEQERNRLGKLTGFVGIVCNILVATAKLVIGLISGAISIVADSINNFSDAVSSVVSFIGFKLSSKPADDGHPFGHARYEYISGFTVSFIVLAAGVELLKTSIKKIVTPQETEYSIILFIILALSILVKIGMAIFNFIVNKKVQSKTIKATIVDSISDSIATSIVLIGAIISYKTGYNLDGCLGTAVSIFVVYSGIKLIIDITSSLLGAAPSQELVDSIQKKIMSYDKVLGTHDLMVHDYGPNHCFASVHVEMSAEENVLECHEIIDSIERDFLENDHIHMVIHYDPISTSEELVGELRQYLQQEVSKIRDGLSIHDLRIVKGENNTNVVFDCVIPHEYEKDENIIKARISKVLKDKYPNCSAVINIDHSFVSMK